MGPANGSQAGEVLRVISSLPIPEDHTSDYQRAVGMLARHVGR